MRITDSLITQNLPSTSPLCLPVWLLTTPFRAGWQQDRLRARCKLWEETAHTFSRDSLLILPFTFYSPFTGKELSCAGWTKP